MRHATRLRLAAPARAAAVRAVPSAPQPEARLGNQAMLRRRNAAAFRPQAKLEVGPVDNPLEREADRVADSVMRMADPDGVVTHSSPRVSRACAVCEAAAVTEEDATPAVSRATASGGNALDGATRGFMEDRFGHDFGNVRVHTGPEAADSAHALGARAFTVGRDVVFAESQYNPANETGRHLLAHELVHTIQQGAAGSHPAVARRQADFGLAISGGAAPALQMVGECTPYGKKDCGGQRCVPASGKGTGFCGWSGTIANGCICITIEDTVADLIKNMIKTLIVLQIIVIAVNVAMEAIIAVVACFMSGVCEAAILAAVLGAAAAAVIVQLLGNRSGGGASASNDAGATAPHQSARQPTPGAGGAPPAPQPA